MHEPRQARNNLPGETSDRRNGLAVTGLGGDRCFTIAGLLAASDAIRAGLRRLLSSEKGVEANLPRTPQTSRGQECEFCQ